MYDTIIQISQPSNQDSEDYSPRNVDSSLLLNIHVNVCCLLVRAGENNREKYKMRDF